MLGFRRNLDPAEILGQILYVLADGNLAINSEGDGSRPALTNLVLMGMGEPLLNLDNVLKSLIILADPRRTGTLSPQNYTVDGGAGSPDEDTGPGSRRTQPGRLAFRHHR